MVPLALVLGAATMTALAAMLRDGAEPGPVALVVFGLMGMGFGLAFTPLMTRTLASVPRAVAADASGILVTHVQLGIVVGIASFGTVFLSLAGASTLSAARALGVTGTAEGVTVLLAAAFSARAAR
ncbi:hypothetical protein [Nocardia sp. bgisy118]|uniref:hypothetical protein n=1 Tax=Nocardia sp. bgisy118 TaxID=3413786 RepID=UPI003F49BB6A